MTNHVRGTARRHCGACRLVSSASPDAGKGVQVTVKEAERRVDVLGRRPAVHVVRLADVAEKAGARIRSARRRARWSRAGFPLDPRPGERVDHPHHVGLWFNYGDVNGYRLLEQLRRHSSRSNRNKMGTIVHQRDHGREGRRRRGRARDRFGLGDARRLGAAEGAHEVRFSRHRDDAHHRPHHDAHRRREARGARRTTRKACSACA